jgi:hypothetical protein
MPGAAAAIQEPWRMAVSYLYLAYGDDVRGLALPFLLELKAHEREVIMQMIKKGINSPLTSSCGRLFDGVAALLDIRRLVNYEAQAAMELEQVIDQAENAMYLSRDGCGACEGALSHYPCGCRGSNQRQRHWQDFGTISPKPGLPVLYRRQESARNDSN